MRKTFKETVYNKSDIFTYLCNRNLNYAADCWADDKGLIGVVTITEASKWFKGYFPSGNAVAEFRYMETQCIGYSQSF